MKTLTEFFGMNLKQAAQIRQDLLSSGKTPEELPAALGEALKIEGERLERLIHALDAVGSRLQDLKRVVVYSAQEGEKAPEKSVQKGEHYYLVEYYPSLEKPKAQKIFDRFEKGDKKGRRNKGRGRRGDKRGERNSQNLAPGSESKTEGSEGQTKKRRRFPRRAPHPQGPAKPTTGRIIPLSEKQAQQTVAQPSQTALTGTEPSVNSETSAS